MTAVLAEYFPNKPFPEENALFRRTLAVWCHTEVGHLDCFLSVDVEDDDEDKFNSLHEAVFEVAASGPLDGSGFEMPAFRHAVGFLMKDKYGWLSYLSKRIVTFSRMFAGCYKQIIAVGRHGERSIAGSSL